MRIETPPVRSPYDNTGNEGEIQNEDIKPHVNRSQTDEERAMRLRSLELMGSLKSDRKMGLGDVVALNLNSIIGTGIFTTPGLILALTKSKTMTLAFWFAGGIYSLLGLIYA